MGLFDERTNEISHASSHFTKGFECNSMLYNLLFDGEENHVVFTNIDCILF